MRNEIIEFDSVTDIWVDQLTDTHIHINVVMGSGTQKIHFYGNADIIKRLGRLDAKPT